jgi:hypothetical protein
MQVLKQASRTGAFLFRDVTQAMLLRLPIGPSRRSMGGGDRPFARLGANRTL